MDSLLTISCKLDVPVHQKPHLDATFQAFADACNYVADWGRENKISHQYALHKGCYKAIRERFGLSANLAVRAIARVAPRLRKAATRDSVFQPTSIDYDARIFRFIEERWSVSLTLLDGRITLALKVGDYQRQALQGKKPTSAVLSKKDKEYYLNIQVKDPVPEPYEPDGILGVDLGIRKIATLSDGSIHGGATLNAYRLKRHRVRRSLQSKADKGTKSTRKNARRVLKRLSGKERRYQQWINHQISKHIVETAQEQSAAIALEDLKGIRARTNKRLRRSQRRLHNSWAFYQLRQFVEYKAVRAGVQVIPVNPAYTSQMCSCCHHIGARSKEHFRCSSCGTAMDADVNGALNIATVGATVIWPEYSPLSCLLPQWAA